MIAARATIRGSGPSSSVRGVTSSTTSTTRRLMMMSSSTSLFGLRRGGRPAKNVHPRTRTMMVPYLLRHHHQAGYPSLLLPSSSGQEECWWSTATGGLSSLSRRSMTSVTRPLAMPVLTTNVRHILSPRRQTFLDGLTVCRTKIAL